MRPSPAGSARLAPPEKGSRRRAWIVSRTRAGSPSTPQRGHAGHRGQTPVLRHRFGMVPLSLAAALTYKYDRSQASLVFAMRPGVYNTESLVDFLTASD